MLKTPSQKMAAVLAGAVLSLPIGSPGNTDGPELKGVQGETTTVTATVWRVKVLLQKNSLAIEIVSTRPIRPAITRTQNPPALHIDINNARVSVRHKQIPVQSGLIGDVRLDQLPQTPPVVRISVEQRKPLSYTWDAAGDRLTIHLHQESEEAAAKPPSVPAVAANREPVAVSANVVGTLVYADHQPSGSSFSAKSFTETLRLSRGGEVRLCPGTTVSMMRQRNGSDLMLAMGEGALETHYALENATVDTIVTPDFRILLRGPGEFHYAIRADSGGNTCVHTLPGNTAPAVVYESIGNGQFEVIPTEKLVLHAGHLSATDTAFHSGQLTDSETIVPDDCGCPSPPPVLRAEATLPTPAESTISPNPSEEDTVSPHGANSEDIHSNSEVAALQPPVAKQAPVKFGATLVFSAKDARAPRLVDLPLSERRIPPLEGRTQPPDPPQDHKRNRKNVLRKLSGFFSRIFG